MESETDLDEEIKRLMAMTQAPQHYPAMVELGTVSSILSLLSHENPEISIDTIELLKELSDEEVLSNVDQSLDQGDDEDSAAKKEGEAGMKTFVNALMDEGLLDLLIQNLGRLDEEEATDRQGVFNTLAIFENLTSIDVTMADSVVKRCRILPWILQRLKVKAFDSNKQYCSELLAIFLQNSPGMAGQEVEIPSISNVHGVMILSSTHHLLFI
jgi:beta-catenin-like protein 1